MKKLRIWEITSKEGRIFIDEYNKRWTVVDGNLEDNSITSITDHMSLDEIMEMGFDEEVDWQSISRGTKVQTSHDGKAWFNNYFHHYNNGEFWTYSDGKDGWTSSGYTTVWEYARLPK